MTGGEETGVLEVEITESVQTGGGATALTCEATVPDGARMCRTARSLMLSWRGSWPDRCLRPAPAITSSGSSHRATLTLPRGCLWTRGWRGNTASRLTTILSPLWTSPGRLPPSRRPRGSLWLPLFHSSSTSSCLHHTSNSFSSTSTSRAVVVVVVVPGVGGLSSVWGCPP